MPRKLLLLMSLVIGVSLLTGITAKATNVDFTCSLGLKDACTGTVTQSGINFSTTGVDNFNDSGPFPVSIPFVLAFNTATGTISIDGTGIETGQDLIGNITSFSVLKGGTTADLSFTAVWPTLPPLVQAVLGTTTGIDSGFVIFDLATGKAQSADIVITPNTVPEPSSLLLLGSGFLGVGGFLRRKLASRK